MTPTDHDIAEVELLPCPFCGAQDGRLVQGFTRATDDFAYWSVECLDCGAEIADDASQAEADRHWNTRATRPQPTDEMCKAIESLGDLLSGSIDVSGTALILSNDSADARVMIQRARDAYDAAESALAAMGEAR